MPKSLQRQRPARRGVQRLQIHLRPRRSADPSAALTDSLSSTRDARVSWLGLCHVVEGLRSLDPTDSGCPWHKSHQWHNARRQRPRAVAPRHTRLTVNLVLRRAGLADLMDIDPLPGQGRRIGGRDHSVVTTVPNRDFRPFPLPRRRLTHQMGFPKSQWKSIQHRMQLNACTKSSSGGSRP
jgi:hypothetical protein